VKGPFETVANKVCLFLALVAIFPAFGLADSDVILAPHRAAVKVVDACIASESFISDPASCAGVSYDVCLTFISGPVSHSEQGGCLYDELGIWDTLYKAEVMKKLQWAQEMDRRGASGTGPNRNALGQVMVTEAAWDVYRKEQCAMEFLPYTGGTVGLTMQPLCLIRLTAQRIQRLREMKFMKFR